MKITSLLQYKTTPVAILWFGKEWQSTLRFLQQLNFSNITILDKKNCNQQEVWIKYIFWNHYLDTLNDYNLIIKTPWISPYNEKIKGYKWVITTQIDIFCNNYQWKIIWITGTKGKSTTSTLLYTTLQNAGFYTKLVWNIWTPVLDEINILEQHNIDYIVFEMSSYMLESLTPKLYIWFINNVYDCHLDWHMWKKNYTQAKLNILTNSSYKVANIQIKSFLSHESIAYFWEGTAYTNRDTWFYIWDKFLFWDTDISLKWDHNKTNICWVIAILDIISKEKNNNTLFNTLKETLLSFVWLPHRMENIWTHNGITFIDDAIATTPESTIAAIKTFDHNIWTIFLWWQDSGFHFNEIRKYIEIYKIPNIVLFPDTGETIFLEAKEYNYNEIFSIDFGNNYKPRFLKTKSMEEAVSFAYKNTPVGKICLLSNAAPSFSLWSWYIQKWLEFQDFVKKYSYK